MKHCNEDQLRNIQIPYIKVDKYHCTQNPATKNGSCGLFIRKDSEASNLRLCYLTGYLEKCVYFHIVFSLLVVDCQLEIFEFLVIYNANRTTAGYEVAECLNK